MEANSLAHVAVVILSYNGLKYTKQFMPTIMASTYANLSVHVIDNASDDDTVAYLKTHYPTVEIIELQNNEGFAGGYNTGLSQIEADYYILLNQDVEVTPGWIEPVIEQMKNNLLIAAAQPKILAQQNKHYFEHAGASGGYIDALGYPFCRGRILTEIERDDGQYNDTVDCFWASGAAIFIRAKLFHQFTGFDADFFAHMEEIDLCWRLQRAGYRIQVVPQSVVYHVGGSVIGYQSPHKAYLNFRNGLVLLHKNLPVTQLFWKMPLRILLDIVAAYRELLGGRPQIFKAIAKAHLHYFIRLFFWQQKRKATQQIVQQHKIGEINTQTIYQKSMVWQYFVMRKKQFKALRY